MIRYLCTNFLATNYIDLHSYRSNRDGLGRKVTLMPCMLDAHILLGGWCKKRNIDNQKHENSYPLLWPSFECSRDLF